MVIRKDEKRTISQMRSLSSEQTAASQLLLLPAVIRHQSNRSDTNQSAVALRRKHFRTFVNEFMAVDFLLNKSKVVTVRKVE